MSVWTTKSSGRDTNYIVLKHTLKGVNYTLNGIRFRDGYAVVEKDSKTHRDLKKIPVLKGAREFSLVFLRKLSFITRPLDVKHVYGADVYVQYLKELDRELVVEDQTKKIEQEVKHVQELKLCSHTTQSKELCKETALETSPSGYCFRHILNEPKLKELGIEIPEFIPKKDKKKVRDEVIEKLSKLNK